MIPQPLCDSATPEMADDRALMQLALDEAAKARGRTSPNPMVGCVIAKNGRLIAKGHHRRAGLAHAERVALRRAGRRARGADLYVNLEPCDHQGRTAPCTDALIAAGIGRVFVATRDPNPLVNGRGIKRLRRAGLRVETGLLAKEARRLNETFTHAIVAARPFVVAKLAQSLDGRVATRSGASQWITGPKARRAGHRLRNELDAILVGVGTVLADDPQLTCRLRGGRDPVRVVLDTRARTSTHAKLIAATASSKAKTIILVGEGAPAQRREVLRAAGAEVITCATLSDGRIDLSDALTRLYRHDRLLSLLVEGGPRVLGSFFDAGLVDKVHAFIAPLIIGGEGALSSVGATGVAALEDAMRLVEVETVQLGRDLHLTGYPARRAR